MRLLLIEDDGDLSAALKRHFIGAGYDVDICGDGDSAAYYLDGGGYSAVILDRLLPGKDGLTILSEMRGQGDTTPVLMLTALDSVGDRTQGLDAGADDYLVKPFAVSELLSRIRALLRRPTALREMDVLSYGGLFLDTRQRTLSCGESTQTLSGKEAAMLELFFENQNRVLSRSEILSRVWGGNESVEDGNVDNYIYFARRRLRAAGDAVQIETVHGVGYRLKERNG